MLRSSRAPEARARTLNWIRRPFDNFRRDRSGVSAIEFALILPVILLMFFGMVELSMALMTQRRASHANAAIGDVSSQYGNATYVNGVAQTAPADMTPATANDVFVAGDLIMAPYPIAPLETRISSIVVDSGGNARINWSCITTATSTTVTMTAPLTAVTKVTTVPTGMLTTTTGDSIIKSESYYPYTSTVQYFIKSPIKFSNTYYFKPRASTTGVGFYPGASSAAWNGSWDTASKAASITASGVTCSYQTG